MNLGEAVVFTLAILTMLYIALRWIAIDERKYK